MWAGKPCYALYGIRVLGLCLVLHLLRQLKVIDIWVISWFTDICLRIINFFCVLKIWNLIESTKEIKSSVSFWTSIMYIILCLKSLSTSLYIHLHYIYLYSIKVTLSFDVVILYIDLPCAHYICRRCHHHTI